MTGYYVIGTLSANIVFLALLIVGVGFAGLRLWRAAMFMLLWLIGYLGLPQLSFGGRIYGAFLFSPFVALLDVVLLIVIAKNSDRLD